MADTDISEVLKVATSNYSLENLEFQESRDVDVLDPDFVGIATVGTHTLFPVPTGKALKSLTVVFTTTATSAGAATVQFTVGGVAMATALALAEMDAGAVVELPVLADGTIKGYSIADPSTIQVEMVVGTAALTAGRFIIIPTYHDIDAILGAVTGC